VVESLEELFERQKGLDLKIPGSVAVYGVGGIGSWIALDFALVGVKKLYVIDPDVIEMHNLNRTPFRVEDIGKPKVQALMELVLERRPETEVIPLREAVENLPADIKEQLKLADVKVDARDTTQRLIGLLEPDVKVGYDGTAVTMDFRKRKNFWGEANTYTVVPSFVVTPQFIASLIVFAFTRKRPAMKLFSFDLDNIWEMLEKGGAEK